jgi:hypothetical protein
MRHVGRRGRAGAIGLMIVALTVAWVGLPVTGQTHGEEEATTALREIQEHLTKMNEILDWVLEGGLPPDQVGHELDQLEAKMDAILALLPEVYGSSFASWFWALNGIVSQLLRAATELADDDTDAALGSLRYAKTSKASFEVFIGDLQALLARGERRCPKGTVLVIVTPCSDMHELRVKVLELLGQGYCVTIKGEVTPGDGVGTAADPIEPLERMVWMVWGALGNELRTSSALNYDPQADATSDVYTDTVRIGDAPCQQQGMREPGTPHPQYGGSTLATGVTQGQPDDLGPSPTLTSDSEAGLWLKIDDVCAPDSVPYEVLIYGPLGTPVEVYEGMAKPPATGCYSSSSNMRHFQLRDPLFLLGGTYWAEVWVDDIHCATHPFTVTVPEQPPFVHNDEVRVASGEAASGNVLDNDFDPNGDPLTVSSWGEPPVGELTGLPDGLFICNPPVDFLGEFSISYYATDGKTDPVMGVLTVVVKE